LSIIGVNKVLSLPGLSRELVYKLTIPVKTYVPNYLNVAESILAEVLIIWANRPSATIMSIVRRPSSGTGFFKMTRRSIDDILLVNESAAGGYEKVYSNPVSVSRKGD
jgi:hypothetical protein